jgi:hypothetical protein
MNKQQKPGRRGFLKALFASFVVPVIKKNKNAEVMEPESPKVKLNDYYIPNIKTVSGVYRRYEFPCGITGVY